MKRFLLAVMLMVPVATVWADVTRIEGAETYIISCGGDKGQGNVGGVDVVWSGIRNGTKYGTERHFVGEGIGKNTGDIYQFSAHETEVLTGAGFNGSNVRWTRLLTSNSVTYKVTHTLILANDKLIQYETSTLCNEN